MGIVKSLKSVLSVKSVENYAANAASNALM